MCYWTHFESSCREVQGKFAHNSRGGAASPFWISPRASARSSHCHSLLHLVWCIFPVHLLLCSLLTQRHIKHHLSWLDVGLWPRAALGPRSQGGTRWYHVAAYRGVLFGAPPWPLVMSKEVKEREGDALGLQVTAIFSLDFVDADQCWHKHRIAEIGFESNSLWKNIQGWCNGRSESASLNIRNGMIWMQAEPQPDWNPDSWCCLIENIMQQCLSNLGASQGNVLLIYPFFALSTFTSSLPHTLPCYFPCKGIFHSHSSSFHTSSSRLPDTALTPVPPLTPIAVCYFSRAGVWARHGLEQYCCCGKYKKKCEILNHIFGSQIQ